ncbi:hypothetical protein PFISCL1PPCAC_28204, partial [Pristionchus fissidentatus]
ASSLGVSGSSSVSSSVQSSMSSPSIPSLSSSVSSVSSALPVFSSSSVITGGSSVFVSSSRGSVPSLQRGEIVRDRPFEQASQGAARAPDLPQDALSSLLQVLRPHLQAAPTHTIPRVSSQELQERLSTLTEFLNQAERVKHGSEDMDALLAAMKQRVQLLVASEKTPGLLDSVARLRVIRDASDGADAGLIAAALQMSERERPFSSARRDRSRSPFRASLSVIRDGLSLDLPDGMDPNYFTFTGNRNSAVEQAEFVAATVLEWLRSGAVVKAEPDEPLAVFPLSVVSNGYHHVGMSEQACQFLGFSWEWEGIQQKFKFKALPFGLSPDTREEAQRAATIVHSDIQSAGMRVNEGKSQWIPSQSGIRGACLEELQREFAGGGLGELGELAEEALRGSLAPSTVTAYSNSDRATYPRHLRILYNKSNRIAMIAPNSTLAHKLSHRFERALREHNVRVENKIVNSNNAKAFFALCKTRLKSTSNASPGIIDLTGKSILAIETVFSWSREWNLSLNESKCTVVNYGSLKPRTQYTINGNDLIPSPSMKDLGVIMQPSLKFSDHVSKLTSKARSKVNIMFKCFYSNDPLLYLQAFNAFIRPLLEYGTVVWSPRTVKLANFVENVQRNFTRRVFFRCAIPYSPYPDRLNFLSMSTLEQRRLIFDLLFLHKTIHNFYSLNSNLLFKISPL